MIPGKADANYQISLADSEHLLKHLAGQSGLHLADIIKNQVEIKCDKIRQGRRGTHTENINPAGAHNGVHHGGKLLAAHLLQGHTNLLNV